MAPSRFSALRRGKRTIKGSAGGGGVKGDLSAKAKVPKNITGPNPPGGPGGPGGTGGPPKPDFRKDPNSQLFNQGLYNLPSLNPVTTLIDPRLQGVSGDSLAERRDTYNRIAAAQRPATGLGDKRITRVSGDSSKERIGQYNRVASGSTPAQRAITVSRMGGTQRGSATAKAGSASLRAGAAASRAAAAPAAKAAPKAAPKAAASKPAGVAKTAPAVVKKATVVKKKTAMVYK